MKFFNSAKTAEVIRSKLIKKGKYLVYLIAKIEGSPQEQGTKKVLDAYFRYKDYIDNPVWYKASKDEVWSPNFLGSSEDFWNKPIQEAKKLEYQNPSYSAAYNLGGDPRDYNKVFTIQLAGCDYDCNYCYVPKELNVANPKLGGYFSAKEILDHFLAAKEKSIVPMNTVRISGGNPTIAPEIIIDIYREIEKRKLNIYIWVDSNLSTFQYMKSLGPEMIDILKQKNVGIVGCFKGIIEEDFSLITGVVPENYKIQFETAKWLIDSGADFYVYLPALAYGENIENNLRKFIERLRRINKNLPLRVEVLEIIDYPWAKLNFKRAEKMGRSLPETDQRVVLDLWYNKLLPEFYNEKELKKYCCQIPLSS